MKDLLEKINKVRTLIIGDIMLDHYIWGDAERISPEAPVPVIDVDKDTYVAGGASNVALNAAALSDSVQLCGYIGDDDAGHRLKQLLNKANIHFHTTTATPTAPTILKTRVLVRNQQLCRLDREEAPTHYELTLDYYKQNIQPQLAEIDVIILSDYAKGVISETLIGQLLKDAETYNVFVAIDPKPKRSINFSNLHLLTPNRTESLQLANIHLEPHQPYPKEAVCAAIWKRFKPKNLIITLGAEGMMISKEGKLVEVILTQAQEVFDVSGAGDTVIAVLSLALGSGLSIATAARLANTAAGIVVGKVGTAVISKKEMLQYSLNTVSK